MYKKGNRWYSDFLYKGQRYFKCHGPVNKTVASEKDMLFRGQVASGEYIREKDNLVFSKAIEEALKRSKAENTDGSYKRNILNAEHLKSFFGDRRISEIESNEVLMRKYINDRKEDIKARQMKRGREEPQVTYTCINRELAFLRSMFNVLILARKASKNPVSLIKLFKEVQKERILTLEEEDKIFSELEKADKRYIHLKDMIIIALNTAMREGEIMAMEKGWINLRDRLIVVPRHSQKGKIKDKRIPINTKIYPIIKRLMGENSDSPYLFVNTKTGTRFTSIQNSWNGILKKAGLTGKPGVDKLRFHDLRHTAATKLATGGMNLKFIAQYLGHTDIRTSARYIHYSDKDLREGAEILAGVTAISTAPILKQP